MPELLFEILCEEIPARMQAQAADDLKRLAEAELAAAALSYGRIETHVTPRRLALLVDGLPERQPDRTDERKGPKEGAPDQAVQGFLKAAGLSALDEAELRDTLRGRFYFAVRRVAGRPTGEVLPEMLNALLFALSWPKSMRWGDDRRLAWVRPIRGLLCVFDGKPLHFALRQPNDEAKAQSLPIHGLTSTGTTTGHRFLAPEPVAVSGIADYLDKLQQRHVILDAAQRRRSIVEQCSALAHAAGLAVKPDSALVDEVTGLVEWPLVLMGRIPAELMDLPPEVLATAMRSHQKYFAVVRPDGKLADRFLLVANMAAPEGSRVRQNIISGNERVLRARLDDARFFWEQDRKRSLESRVAELAEIVFHARLGSLRDKSERLTALAGALTRYIPGANAEPARIAARLCKADLTTGMVGEFPELQGIMGRYYALNDGLPEAVAQAIAEHYAPLGPADPCPSAPVSIAVGLADKLDTLVGFWSIGEKPTGSKDPFALRRAALGVIRLIVENRLRLPLMDAFAEAQLAYRNVSTEPVGESLLAFFAERLKVALREQGVRHDLITAVFSLGGEDDLVRLLARVEALDRFLKSDDGANLLVAFRRAANIVSIEEKKDQRRFTGAVNESALVEAAETALYQGLEAAAARCEAALAREDFTGAMEAMATLRAPVDAFFDRVTVNAEDSRLRENRLRLLAKIGATLGRVADFSKVES